MSSVPRLTRKQASRAMRWAREASGLTQEAAGRAVGVTRQTIASWEGTNPSPAALYVMLLLRSRAAARLALLEAIDVPYAHLAAVKDPELVELIDRLRDMRESDRWPDARDAIDALLHGLRGD